MAVYSGLLYIQNAGTYTFKTAPGRLCGCLTIDNALLNQ